jgi:adenylate kinase
MRVIVTGTPGTGKSVVAKMLAKEAGLELIDIKEIVRRKMRLGPSREVDLRKLASALRFLKRKKDYVVEGHLACEIRLPADFVFVLRTRPDILRRRLALRRYRRQKLEENLMAEMLDYCTQRAGKVYGKAPLELDTTRLPPSRCVRKMVRAMRQKKKKLDRVDYSAYIIKGGSP